MVGLSMFILLLKIKTGNVTEADHFITFAYVVVFCLPKNKKNGRRRISAGEKRCR